MGVIQQSFNQAISIAGLANQLRKQNPNYQKKMEEKDFKKSLDEYEKAQEALDSKRLKSGPSAQKELENAQIQLGEKHAADLLARGKYEAYANQVRNNANGKAFFERQVPPEYDEQRAQAANQRAEDTARQIAEQNQRNRDIVRQLRGLLPMSQELVAKHKEGIK